MKKSIIISIALAGALFGASIDIKEAPSNYERVNPGFNQDVVLSYHSSLVDVKKSVVNIATKTKIKAGNSPLQIRFQNRSNHRPKGAHYGFALKRQNPAS